MKKKHFKIHIITAFKLTDFIVPFFTILLLILSSSSYSQITGVCSQSGPSGEWQAQAGIVYVRVISSSRVIGYTAETIECPGAYSDRAVDNNPSLRFTENGDATTPINGNITFGFFDGVSSSTPAFVDSPIIHIDRVGGASGVVGSQLSNSGHYTISNGTWTELYENGVHFETTSTTFFKTTGVLMDDPNDTECATSPSAGTFNGTSGPVQFNLGTEPTQVDADDDGILDFVETAHGADSGQGIGSSQDINTSNCATDLELTKTVANIAGTTITTANVGDTIVYTITVTNNSPYDIDVADIVAVDNLPVGVTYSSSSPTDIPTGTTFGVVGTTGTWDFGAEVLAQGANLELKRAVILGSDCDDITNIAEVFSSTPIEDIDSIPNSGN